MLIPSFLISLDVCANLYAQKFLVHGEEVSLANFVRDFILNLTGEDHIVLGNKDKVLHYEYLKAMLKKYPLVPRMCICGVYNSMKFLGLMLQYAPETIEDEEVAEIIRKYVTIYLEFPTNKGIKMTVPEYLKVEKFIYKTWLFDKYTVDFRYSVESNNLTLIPYHLHREALKEANVSIRKLFKGCAENEIFLRGIAGVDPTCPFADLRPDMDFYDWKIKVTFPVPSKPALLILEKSLQLKGVEPGTKIAFDWDIKEQRMEYLKKARGTYDFATMKKKCCLDGENKRFNENFF